MKKGDIYRKAAERLFTMPEGRACCCWALRDCGYGCDDFGALFGGDDTKLKYDGGWAWSMLCSSNEKAKEQRALALCFMGAISDAPD